MQKCACNLYDYKIGITKLQQDPLRNTWSVLWLLPWVCQTPPKSRCFSMTVKAMPLSSIRLAAITPTTPPPMMATSMWLLGIGLPCFGATILMYTLRPYRHLKADDVLLEPVEVHDMVRLRQLSQSSILSAGQNLTPEKTHPCSEVLQHPSILREILSAPLRKTQ